MRVLIVCSVMAFGVFAEPPVDNRYLPPQQGGFGPSQSYGAPSAGPQKQTDAVFRGRPSSNYGAPSNGRQNNQNGRQPSNQYGPPRSQPQSQYIPPSNSYSAPVNQPSNQYGAPSLQSGPSNRQFNAPSNEYLPPSNTPSNQYGAPQAQGRNGFGSRPGEDFNAPSQQYGSPNVGSEGNQQFGGAQSRQYLPPGGGRGGYGGGDDDDGSNGEPANYSFEYMVKDDESGNDFGHRESRMGDRAEGLYYVLLPDGRKQTVEYVADQEGYRPKISYEDSGAGAGGAGGYDSNSQGRQGGFNGGPY